MHVLSKTTYRFFQWFLPFAILIFVIGIYNYWPSIVSWVIEGQKRFHGLLATHVNAIAQDPIHHGLMLIVLSFVYGVFHAVGPGHGKAVIVTYLGSHKASLRRGALISFLAALLQSTVAILLVILISQVLSIRFSDVNSYANDITQVSYVLVMLLGAFLFLTASLNQWKNFRKNIDKQAYIGDPKHEHEHHHEHSCCGGHHVHQSDPKESWLQSISVIFSMGIRPCSGAIVVLIYAHLVGALYYGVIATLVMGLGTGFAIASLALGTQLARSWFERLAQPNNKPALFHFNLGSWLRIVGGGIIFLLGLGLYQAATQISGHPLL